MATPTINYLILCGKDSEGHKSGQTFLSLGKNGVDKNMRVIGSKGKKLISINTTTEEINSFRNQIAIIDKNDCEDLKISITLIGIQSGF